LKKITGLKNPNKNQKALITKIKSFESWLLNQNLLKVRIIEIDDGVAVCYKTC
jgi:predicted O-methyltransferase YrrM